MSADYKRLINYIRGGEVLPNENHHSEGAAGKAAYHRQHCSDGMLSHQGEFSWAIPRQDPLHKLTHFGTLLGARPVLGAHFTWYPSGGCFDCAYGFAQHDIIYERHFFDSSANEKTATGDKLSLSPLAVDVNVCSCKIRVSKTCAYLCACKHTCAVVCNKCSSHCSSPQSIAK